MYDVQAINSAEERHQRALDAVFGPETRPGYTPSPSDQPFHPDPGQAPVSNPDPGPAPAVMPYDKVYGALLNDPEVLGLFREHWDDVLHPMDFGPPPPQPQDRYKWRLMRDVADHLRGEFKPHFKDAKKHRVRERVEQLFHKLEQTDPLYELTKDVMEHVFERLPTASRKALGRLFTRCPKEVLEFYQEVREVAEEVIRIRHKRRAGK